MTAKFPLFLCFCVWVPSSITPALIKNCVGHWKCSIQKRGETILQCIWEQPELYFNKIYYNLIHKLLLLALLIRRYHKYIHNLILQFHSTLAFPQRDYGSPFPWHMQAPRCPKTFSFCLDPFLSPTPISLSTYKICVSTLVSLVDWDYYTK